MSALRFRPLRGFTISQARHFIYGRRTTTNVFKTSNLWTRARPFSPVPYALLCRAIELELKSRLLEITPGREGIRKKYSHKILKAYLHLPPEQQILSEGECAVLGQASELYAARDKHFDYPPPEHAFRGYMKLGRSAAGKKSGASRKDSLAFFAITSPSVHSVQRPENINNLTPSLRLDGKASGQTLTEIGRI